MTKTPLFVTPAPMTPYRANRLEVERLLEEWLENEDGALHQVRVFLCYQEHSQGAPDRRDHWAMLWNGVLPYRDADSVTAADALASQSDDQELGEIDFSATPPVEVVALIKAEVANTLTAEGLLNYQPDED